MWRKNHCCVHSSLDLFFHHRHVGSIYVQRILLTRFVPSTYFLLHPEWHLRHFFFFFGGGEVKDDYQIDKLHCTITMHRKAIFWSYANQTCMLFREQIWQYHFRNRCNRTVSPYMHGNLVCCWAHLHGLAVWTLRDFSPALMED